MVVGLAYIVLGAIALLFSQWVLLLSLGVVFGAIGGLFCTWLGTRAPLSFQWVFCSAFGSMK